MTVTESGADVFAIVVDLGQTGLTPTAKIIASNGVLARSITSGVYELPATGFYRVPFQAPADDGSYLLAVNDGNGIYATFGLEVVGGYVWAEGITEVIASDGDPTGAVSAEGKRITAGITDAVPTSLVAIPDTPYTATITDSVPISLTVAAVLLEELAADEGGS